MNSQGVSLNHVIVTHIDKDHISPFIKIDEIWHNSFKHIKDFNFNNWVKV